MQGIVLIILLLAILLIHQQGQYATAKRAGVQITECSLGFGPKLASYQGQETLWLIRLIPLGGFIKMKDETFLTLSPYKRIAILFGGIVTNTAGTILLFCIVGFIGIRLDINEKDLGESAEIFILTDPQIRVKETHTNSETDKAGILPGDQLLSINEYSYTSIQQAKDYLKTSGKKLQPCGKNGKN